MRSNFFKEWINSMMYPMPVIWATKEVWEDFAEHATFSRLQKAFRENKDNVLSTSHRENLEVILRKLAKGNWPVLSDDFIGEHPEDIWKISSAKTIEQEVQNYHFESAKYLIDEDNQMLGVIVSKDVVITGLVNEAIKARFPDRNLVCNGLLPTKEQMKIIGKHKDDINRLLSPFGLKLAANYWVEADDGFNIVVWGAPAYFRPCMGDDDLASLICLIN